MRASGKPFLLSQRQKLNINIGLYRDCGLAISNATPRETDNRKYAEVFFLMRRRKKLFRYGRGIFNHRRTISHNASSKKSINFYAESTRITVPLVYTLTRKRACKCEFKNNVRVKKTARARISFILLPRL